MDTRQSGVRAIILGWVLLMAGLLLRMASAQPSSGSMVPLASRKAMTQAINVPLGRLGPRGSHHQTFVGQEVHSTGGFGTRYATYVSIVSQHGRIVYWGDGLASWDAGHLRPDVNLTAFPINGAGLLYRLLSRPSGSVVRYTKGASVPKRGVAWYALLIPGHRVMFAVDPQCGVWIFEGARSGRLSQVMGPPLFGSSK